jgi:hypothetical protein
MPIVNSDGDIRNDSGISIGCSAVPPSFWTCPYRGPMRPSIQNKPATFVCETPDLPAIGVFVAKADHGTLYAHAFSYRERGL